MLDIRMIHGEGEYREALAEPVFRQRLLFFKAGTLNLSLRGEARTVVGPALVNHSPLAEIRLLPALGDGAALTQAYLLSFDGHSMDKLIAEAFLLLCPMTGVFRMRLTLREFSTLGRVLGLMTEDSLGADILETQALLLVKYLASFQKDTNSYRFVENDLVKQYVACVDRDHETSHEIAFYADKLGVSTRTLNRVFKEATGITPKASLSYRLNLAAKRQLLERRKSVKEISFGLGFTSPEYFHMFFRKSNGITPGEYVRATG
ncbi:MAG: helix-turn-helix domain-containing protein [Spirochaetota bacterium]